VLIKLYTLGLEISKTVYINIRARMIEEK